MFINPRDHVVESTLESKLELYKKSYFQDKMFLLSPLNTISHILENKGYHSNTQFVSPILVNISVIKPLDLTFISPHDLLVLILS